MDASTQSRSTWVTRNLVVLSLVSLLQDSASELLYPVLPIFLTYVTAQVRDGTIAYLPDPYGLDKRGSAQIATSN